MIKNGWISERFKTCRTSHEVQKSTLYDLCVSVSGYSKAKVLLFQYGVIEKVECLPFTIFMERYKRCTTFWKIMYKVLLSTFFTEEKWKAANFLTMICSLLFLFKCNDDI